eukprot:2529525-Alexandrium_andersonii.AAC.1
MLHRCWPAVGPALGVAAPVLDRACRARAAASLVPRCAGAGGAVLTPWRRLRLPGCPRAAGAFGG